MEKECDQESSVPKKDQANRDNSDKHEFKKTKGNQNEQINFCKKRQIELQTKCQKTTRNDNQGVARATRVFYKDI